MPTISDLVAKTNATEEEVRLSLEHLAAAKALVVMPESGEILMANPWSAVPTAYVVEAKGKTWYANCAWDALAIPAAMGTSGKMTTSCACCGEAMTAEVENRKLVSGDGLVHIATPAKFWWNDIFFS